MPASPRILTIPPSVPFLRRLACAILDGAVVEGWPDRADPLSLAEGLILLPTRRACRVMREAFLLEAGSDAMLLPRILPMGDVDEEEWTFGDPDPRDALGLEGLPPAIGKRERLLLLAVQVRRWAESIDRATMRLSASEPFLVGTSLTDAIGLAAELMKLLDQMETEQVPFSALAALDDSALDVYWQMSARFLTVIGEVWPSVLAAMNLSEPARRRDMLLAVEAERLRTLPGPVIAAGSTGSIRATRDLLKAVADNPRGAVVLPGLDMRLDESAFGLVGFGDSDAALAHPQYGLKRLIAHLGVTRDAVIPLGPARCEGREVWLSEAMRPAGATDAWRDTAKTLPDDALDSLTLIEADGEQEEALALALVLRQKAEGHTPVALITPDRLLARRVMAELTRWAVPYDDSGGGPLLEAEGALTVLRLARLALGPLPPGDLLSLLQGEALAGLAPDGLYHAARRAIDLVGLRGLAPRGGLAGVAERLRDAPDTGGRGDPVARVDDTAREAGRATLAALTAALQPLSTLARGEAPLATLAQGLLNVLDALALPPLDGLDATRAILTDLSGPAGALTTLAAEDFPSVLTQFLRAEIRRPPGARGALIRIFGLPEARLADAPCLVLGGLNEGGWPGAPKADPFLSRAMRGRIGLEPPERRVSLAAHDFCQTAAAEEIIYSRAQKAGGVPTVASRWLQRMAAVAGPQRWETLKARGEEVLRLARALDAPDGPVAPAPRPAPRPPRAARPTRFSATRIETLIRDPYALYAERVLQLVPLREADEPPGYRERGTLMHEAIALAALGGAFEQDRDACYAALIAAGRQAFAPLAHDPAVMSFWWPRYQRIARWLAEEEAAQRASIAQSLIEEQGETQWQAASGRAFRLTARADRIIERTDGTLAILDYKTGSPPTNTQVLASYAQQLPLEGAIARLGGFGRIAAGKSLSQLAYIHLNGQEPPAERREVKPDKQSLDDLADASLEGTRALLEAYEDEATPYVSHRLMQFTRSVGTYDHLARVAEWSAGEEEGS